MSLVHHWTVFCACLGVFAFNGPNVQNVKLDWRWLVQVICVSIIHATICYLRIDSWEPGVASEKTLEFYQEPIGKPPQPSKGSSIKGLFGFVGLRLARAGGRQWVHCNHWRWRFRYWKFWWWRGPSCTSCGKRGRHVYTTSSASKSLSTTCIGMESAYRNPSCL